MSGAITRSARSAGLITPETNVHGPSQAAVEASQKYTPLQGLGDLSQGAILEIGTTVLQRGALGAAAAFANIGMTVYSLMSAFVEAGVHGDAQARAYERDSVHLATAWAAAAALPPAYIQQMNSDYRRVGGAAPLVAHRGGANKISSKLMASGEWKRIEAQAVEHANLGRDVAKSHFIHSKAALSERLNRDARFRNLYNSNIAFKHGVDSIVFEKSLASAGAAPASSAPSNTVSTHRSPEIS